MKKRIKQREKLIQQIKGLNRRGLKIKDIGIELNISYQKLMYIIKNYIKEISREKTIRELIMDYHNKGLSPEQINEQIYNKEEQKDRLTYVYMTLRENGIYTNKKRGKYSKYDKTN